MKKQSGFIQIIALVIIFVVVLLYFGKNPVGIWQDVVRPIFVKSLDILVKIIDFLVKFISDIWNKR
jgi:hypothetical protein